MSSLLWLLCLVNWLGQVSKTFSKIVMLHIKIKNSGWLVISAFIYLSRKSQHFLEVLER